MSIQPAWPAKRVPGDEPISWPAREKASRAVRDYLSALDDGSAEAPAADGGRARKPRMAISLTDPQAAWVAYRKIRSIFAYHANYLIDNKLGVIVDAEGNRANRIDENRAALAMVERVAGRFALKPKRLAADTAYGNARTLKKLVEKGIEPHIRLRLRGLSGVRDEVLLTATAQNLRKLVKYAGPAPPALIPA